MEKLLEKPVFSPDYNSARDNLFIQLYPRIGNIGDPVLLATFLKFRDLLKEQEIVYNIKKGIDTITVGIEQIVQYLTDDSTAILSKYSQGVPNSLVQVNTTKDMLTRRIGELNEYIVKVDPILAPQSRNLITNNIHKLMNNTVGFNMQCNSFLSSIQNIIRMSTSPIPQNLDFTKQYWRAIGGARPGLFFDPDINQILKALSDMLLRQKDEFDARVRKKIDFYKTTD
jgi:hypothetical protein